MRLISLLVTLFGLVAAHEERQINVQAFPAAFPDSCFAARELATDLGFITDVCTLDSQRALVLEKGGRVYLIKQTNGRYTNLGSIYKFDVIQAGELGLVSCAADPNFSNGTPHVFFLYTRKTSDTFGSQTISRMSYNFATDRLEAATTIFGACNTRTNCLVNPSHVHTGGSLLFDPNDANVLYWTKGDSKRNEDGEAAIYWRLNEPQTTTTYLGKVMRIDKRTGLGVPSNYWFDGNADSIASRIFAIGFRNPWVIQFNEAGRLNVYDVGWNKKEAVKEIYNGAVSGWPCYEGTAIAGQRGGANPCSIVNPRYNRSITVAEYDGPGACIIGATYFGSAYPSRWANKILVGDYNRGTLSTFDGKTFTPFATNALSTTHIRAGPNGNAWFVSRDNNGALREIYWRWNEGNCGTRSVVTTRTTQAAPTATTTSAANQCAPTGQAIKALPPGWNAITYMSAVGTQNLACTATDQSIGKVNCTTNINAFGRPINIANRRYNSGVSVTVPRTSHQRAVVSVKLNGTCARFEATLGAEVAGVTANISATLGAEFAVYGDGRLLYNSTASRGAKGPVGIQSAEGINVNVLGVNNLEVRVRRASGPGSQIGFIGNLGNARFLCGPNALMLPKMPTMAPSAARFNPTVAVPLNSLIPFAATVTDVASRAIPPANIDWDVSLIHCTTTQCHEHFDVDAKQGSSTFNFATGDGHGIGDCVFAEIRATVRDTCGRLYWKTYALKLAEQEAACGTLTLQPKI
jgi:glucose/arabinose dehydrogenase